MVIYDDNQPDGLPWWAIVVVALAAVLAIALSKGCSLGEQFREPLTDAATAAVTPFTTETFWYDAARGILRAWGEAFTTPAPAVQPAREGWLANADGPLAILVYLGIHRFTPLRRLADWIKGEAK